MNIRIEADKADCLHKICKDMKMTPSQLMEYFLDILHHLYSDYEGQKTREVKKEAFKEFLTNLFLDKAKLQCPDIAERLIESTNELLGIKEYVDAGIYNVYLDLYGKRFLYTIGYEFVDADNMNLFKGLLIDVEINQDYVQVSHRTFPYIHECIELTDKKIEDTSNLVQEFIRDVHHEEFSPFVNFDVEISPTIDSTGKHQTIGIKLIIKADKATHIPSMETISHLIRGVHGMAIKNFVAK
jgi:hypothetical protein